MKPSFLLLIITGSLVGIGIIASIKHFSPTKPAPEKPVEAEKNTQKPSKVGDILHTFNGVHVYENGDDYLVSHSKHNAKDGYYYGHQWQCVEFIKRYYHDAHDHHMPDVMGHAKHFFDTNTSHGQLNKARNMIQYKNGGKEKPKVYDLLVWNHNSHGHVAVISEVRPDYVIVVQQNVKGYPTQKLSLVEFQGHYNISKTGDNPPVGWLRLP